ncbi:hypothetical protein BV924_16430 [Pectobacterium odoriferum]|uniref:Uncharacterized protein n=1 Tax=Pectobacterium odoriferum TaxID=78398 RepID=A0ABD6VP53_9GAMM|nr:hypothetical protein [Pectobacterium odoriferum]POD94215.1 hypothetical protein BVY06_16115 [Pectobacterium odoriferum]POE10748.1 hypothetical protein BV924_16430 [Pectobacterium odoriferum]POE25364.1 hypothetical protein BV926_16380 [Pectobacterium odoriferum]POE29728.1 hypothetical protein BV919_16400 [Pectobacterium odoriferum]POE38387.1 hypothetical protein BV920_16860 [Pectobacterium odoriferum]
MNLDNLKVVNVFRSGTHKDGYGSTITISDADMGNTAAAYNALSKTHGKAPLFLGHPRSDATSYGDIVGLAVAGNNMLALLDPKPELVSWVKRGDINAVSMSYDPPDSQHNPYPGVYYPRHLGFLGPMNGMKPAIKNLEPLAFMESPEMPVTFSNGSECVYFSEYDAIVDKKQAGIDRLAREFSVAGNVSYEQGLRISLEFWSY